ncbi:6-phosphofructo-2-kinase 2 [[Candida] railenensis]|uniref:6-phosphofructo-2-kinase 2 n=1 Tax=[Candida] railenensis TaxID=45579 RepID=A0A9P0VWG0_9ASCO|nr:6-phosphofructo-2-kinase 2 [[Candida] railenensis]
MNSNNNTISSSSSNSSLDYMFGHKMTSNNCSMISTAATSVAMTPTGSFESHKINTNYATGDGSYFVKSVSISLQPKTIVILIGLPASGKSTICKQLASYLNGNGSFCKIYNTGDVRRQEHEKSSSFDNSDYFDPANISGKCQRDHFALMALDTMLQDLKSNKISCGFLDATNTTLERRRLLMSVIQNTSLVKIDNVVLFDVQVDDPSIINYNINGKAYNPDYRDKDYEYSIRDFKRRADNYHKAYVPINQEELEQYSGLLGEYISIKNAGEGYKFVDFKDKSRTTIDAKNINSGMDSNPSSTMELIEDFVKHYKEKQGKQYLEAVQSFYGK